MFRHRSIVEKSCCASAANAPKIKMSRTAVPLRDTVFTRRDVLPRVPLLSGWPLAREPSLSRLQRARSPLLSSPPPRPPPLSFLLPLPQRLSPGQHPLRSLRADGSRDNTCSISPARSYPSTTNQNAPAGSIHKPCPS